MTKEEYIGKYPIVCNNEGTKLYLDRDDVLKAMDEWAGYLISNSSHTTTMLEVPKHILDEYAKQQAIAFARFVISKYEPHGDNYVSIDKMDNTVYFSDELYSKFIEYQLIKQQNKP